jgi:hypothetical protein
MSRKNATHFQSEHSGQRRNGAQKSKDSRAHQPDQPNTPKPEPMNIVDRSVCDLVYVTTRLCGF